MTTTAAGAQTAYGSVEGACAGAEPQRRGLADTATNRWLAAGIGLLADSYDLFAIDFVVLILELQHGEQVVGVSEKSLLVSSMLAGVIIGQLTFGYIADWLGRRSTGLVTSFITISGALICACAGLSGGTATLCHQLALGRFWLGLGVGGEYPVTAAVSCEISSDPDKRGRNMASTISMQGWGMLLCALVAMALVGGGASLEATWRWMLAIGAIPSCVDFIVRFSLRHLDDTLQEDKHQDRDGQRQPSLVQDLIGHQRLLVGTAGCWFLMNFSLYSMGSFKSSILNDALELQKLSPSAQVMKMSQLAIFTSVCAILGFAVAFQLINRMGRYNMQFWGFQALGVTFLLLVLVSTFSQVQNTARVSCFLFGQMFFFQNFGPNTTTYVVAAEVFPTRIRGSCHGISAACGKVGALIGSMLLSPVADQVGIEAMYGACAAAAWIGASCTWACTPRTSEPHAAVDSQKSLQGQSANCTF